MDLVGEAGALVGREFSRWTLSDQPAGLDHHDIDGSEVIRAASLCDCLVVDTIRTRDLSLEATARLVHGVVKSTGPPGRGWFAGEVQGQAITKLGPTPRALKVCHPSCHIGLQCSGRV